VLGQPISVFDLEQQLERTHRRFTQRAKHGHGISDHGQNSGLGLEPAILHRLHQDDHHRTPVQPQLAQAQAQAQAQVSPLPSPSLLTRMASQQKERPPLRVDATMGSYEDGSDGADGWKKGTDETTGHGYYWRSKLRGHACLSASVADPLTLTASDVEIMWLSPHHTGTSSRQVI
jgi:hypothetical protein